MLDTERKSSSQPNLSSGKLTGPISYADALENYRTNTDWWIVFDSFELPNAKGNSLAISSRTGISVEVVSEALEGMIVLGLLKRTENGYESTKNTIHLSGDGITKQKRIEEHALISRQVINHLTENAKGALRFASFASSTKIIAEMYEKINTAILEADEKSKSLSRDQIDNVYLLSFTTVSATQPQAEKGAHNA